jgi:hypothetical protein
MKKARLFLLVALGFSGALFSQVTSTGKVIDENQQPLPGATVVIKGTTTGVSTDFDGVFTLEHALGENTVLVSYIGYQTQEFTLGQDNNIFNCNRRLRP